MAPPSNGNAERRESAQGGPRVRKSPLELYAPFLVFVLVQALVIAVAPSRSPGVQIGSEAAPGQTVPGSQPGAGPGGQGGATPPSSTAGPIELGEGPADVGVAGGGDASAGGTSGTGGDPGTGGGASGGATGGSSGASASGPSAAEGDTSHCTDDGRQSAVLYMMPTCVPRWEGGDNGGATYRGVTQDEITVVYFREDKNEQVTTLLNSQDLRATREQEVAFMEAAQDFLNKHYEFYGRELDLVIYDAESCPESPPDVAACVQEARKMIAELQPFAVVWPVPLYPTVFDEFVRAGVVSIGGWHFDASYYNDRRPYRWDVFMDGTQTAELASEYYCRKLANAPATNAGPVIHPSFDQSPDRDNVPRKLAVFVPDSEAQALPGERVVERVRECSDTEPILITYSQDIDTGSIQAGGNTQTLIDEQVTTIMCICDPVTPIFRTNDNDQNNYYPEYLLSGGGLLDYDKLGRLYNPQSQWLHAFGPSHLANVLPIEKQTQAVMWNDVRDEQHPCQVPCGLHAAYYNMVGWMLQTAGPDLNPATVEQGMFQQPARGGWEETGGDPHYQLFEFGQNDYTGVSDAREVWWSNDRRSRVDGQSGSYQPMHDGQRYTFGEWTATFDVPPQSR